MHDGQLDYRPMEALLHAYAPCRAVPCRVCDLGVWPLTCAVL